MCEDQLNRIAVDGKYSGTKILMFLRKKSILFGIKFSCNFNVKHYQNVMLVFSFFFFVTRYLHTVWRMSNFKSKSTSTSCPRSSYPFQIITDYIKWVTTSWANRNILCLIEYLVKTVMMDTRLVLNLQRNHYTFSRVEQFDFYSDPDPISTFENHDPG